MDLGIRLRPGTLRLYSTSKTVDEFLQKKFEKGETYRDAKIAIDAANNGDAGAYKWLSNIIDNIDDPAVKKILFAKFYAKKNDWNKDSFNLRQKLFPVFCIPKFCLTLYTMEIKNFTYRNKVILHLLSS